MSDLTPAVLHTGNTLTAHQLARLRLLMQAHDAHRPYILPPPAYYNLASATVDVLPQLLAMAERCAAAEAEAAGLRILGDVALQQRDRAVAERDALLGEKEDERTRRMEKAR